MRSILALTKVFQKMLEIGASSGSRRPTSKVIVRLLTTILVILGLVSRAFIYLSNGSLGSDEAKLAINLIEKNWAELFAPLSYNQAAPVGFLILQKFVTTTLGPTEWSLRLVPFTASIASLVASVVLMKRVLKTPGFLFGIAAISVGEFVISQASNAKQYSTDILVALLLTIEFLRYNGFPRTGVHNFRIAVTGILAMVFSQPSVFIVASIGISILTRRAQDERVVARRIPDWIIVSSWVLVFGMLYLCTIQPLSGNEFLHTYWMESRNGSPNWNGSFVSAVSWLPRAIAAAMREPVGLGSAWVAVAVLFVGAIHLWRSDRERFRILATPILLSSCAAVIGKFPFADRMLFFLVPSFLGVIGAGVDALFQHRFRFLQVTGCAVVVAILGPSVRLWATDLYPVRERNAGIRSLLVKLAPNLAPGDVIYARKMAGPTVQYYLQNMKVITNNSRSLIVDDYYRPPRDGERRELRRVTSQYLPFSSDDLLRRAGNSRTWVIVQARRIAVDDVSKDEFIVEFQNVATQGRTISAPGVGAFEFVPRPSSENGD